KAKELAQRARISPQDHEVVFVDDPAHEGRHKGAARLHKLLDLFREAVAGHVQGGGEDDVVAGQVHVGMDDVDRQVLLPACSVVRFDLRDVFQVDARAAGVLQSPPVLPVKQDGDPGLDPGVDQGVAELLELPPQLGDLPKGAGDRKSTRLNSS